MSMVQVEKNVPIPSTVSHGNTKYPWHEMEVGGSFIYEGNPTGAHNSAYQASRFGKKFKARKTEDGMRIWRVA